MREHQGGGFRVRCWLHTDHLPSAHGSLSLKARTRVEGTVGPASGLEELPDGAPKLLDEEVVLKAVVFPYGIPIPTFRKFQPEMYCTPFLINTVYLLLP